MQKSIPWKNSSWKASGPGAKCPVEGGERSEGISQGPTVRAARAAKTAAKTLLVSQALEAAGEL